MDKIELREGFKRILDQYLTDFDRMEDLNVAIDYVHSVVTCLSFSEELFKNFTVDKANCRAPREVEND